MPEEGGERANPEAGAEGVSVESESVRVRRVVQGGVDRGEQYWQNEYASEVC